jgi:hypothetical protein
VSHRFHIRRTLHAALASLPEIVHGAVGVPPTHKVHGQLCRHVTGLGAMARLQADPNALVQPHPLRGRDPLIEHLRIQGMDKAIGAGHRAVWPRLFSARPQELPPPGQGRTAVIHLLHLLSQPRRHTGRRELHPGHARRL